MRPEEQEALEALVGHYGLPVLLRELDVIVERIQRGILSAPLDKDPEKASISLYAERMKAEGAIAAKQALISRIEAVKQGMRVRKV